MQHNNRAFSTAHLTVHYEQTPVLWDINAWIPQGVLAAVIGPNGAGKSTLFKAALNFIRPQVGAVAFFEQPLRKVKSRVAYVPQRESVDWDFPITTLDLVLMGCYGRLKWGLRPSSTERDKAHAILGEMGLAPFAKRQIGQLSGGQQQRAFLGRALMQEADIYFLDEPLASIDMGSETLIIQKLKELKKLDKTLILVHHDLHTVTRYFDWLIVLNTRLIACGPTCEVFNAVTLKNAYGQQYELFGNALELARAYHVGLAT